MLAPVAERAGQNSCHFTGRGAENLPAVLPRAITVFLRLKILAFFTQKFAPKRRCPQADGLHTERESRHVALPERRFHPNVQRGIICIVRQLQRFQQRSRQYAVGGERQFNIVGKLATLWQKNAAVGLLCQRPFFIRSRNQRRIFVVLPDIDLRCGRRTSFQAKGAADLFPLEGKVLFLLDIILTCRRIPFRIVDRDVHTPAQRGIRQFADRQNDLVAGGIIFSRYLPLIRGLIAGRAFQPGEDVFDSAHLRPAINIESIVRQIHDVFIAAFLDQIVPVNGIVQISGHRLFGVILQSLFLIADRPIRGRLRIYPEARLSVSALILPTGDTFRENNRNITVFIRAGDHIDALPLHADKRIVRAININLNPVLDTRLDKRRLVLDVGVQDGICVTRQQMIRFFCRFFRRENDRVLLGRRLPRRQVCIAVSRIRLRRSVGTHKQPVGTVLVHKIAPVDLPARRKAGINLQPPFRIRFRRQLAIVHIRIRVIVHDNAAFLHGVRGEGRNLFFGDGSRLRGGGRLRFPGRGRGGRGGGRSRGGRRSAGSRGRTRRGGGCGFRRIGRSRSGALPALCGVFSRGRGSRLSRRLGRHRRGRGPA